MQVKLTNDGEIQFLDGDHINRNSLNRKTLIVTLETALATRESLWVQFGDSQNFEDVNANILEPIRLSEEEDGYKTIFPDELVKKAGVWYMTLAIRTYSTTDETTFSKQETSDKVSFTVNDSYPMDDGGYISNGTIENAWQQIKDAEQDAEDSANSAEQAATAAQNAQKASEAAQTEAEAAQAAAEAAQEAAETAEDNAKDSETAAQGYASAASGSAGQAAGSAEQAAGSATAAGQSASAAANSATQAKESASAASGSAQSAQDSADLAQGYMEQAKDYAKKEYKIVASYDELPRPGDPAFIYLVPTTEPTASDQYTEYLWIAEKNDYEYVGSLNDVNLDGYAQTNGTYPNMTAGKATNDGNGLNIAQNYVKVVEQALTAEQQEQARRNIDAQKTAEFMTSEDIDNIFD